MCRRLLRPPQLEVALAPAAEARKPQPSLDDSIDVIEHEYFSEHQLALWPRIEFADGLIPQTQQLGTRELLLVLFNPLSDEFLVLAAQRLSPSLGTFGLGTGLHGTVNLAIAGRTVKPSAALPPPPFHGGTPPAPFTARRYLSVIPTYLPPYRPWSVHGPQQGAFQIAGFGNGENLGMIAALAGGLLENEASAAI